MSGYIDNYGSPANPVVNISGNPLTVWLNFEDKGATAPTDHPLLAFAGLVTLPPALLTLLQTPINQIADQVWAQDQDANGQTMRDRTGALLTGQIPGAVSGIGSGFSAYDISVSLPATGIMRCIVLSGDLTNPDAAQIVLLSYELTGISASFAVTTPYTGGINSDPTYLLTLDVELLMQLVVPLSPGAIAPTASFNVENANISATNPTAAIGDAIEAVMNFFTNQPTNIFQAAEGSIDGSGNASANLASFSAPLTQLSSAWQAASTTLGFTQMRAFIDSRPALNFRFIHPPDGAPAIVNAAIPAYPSLFPPLMGLSAAVVQAGGSLEVTGTNFPVGQASRLYISWNDTVSGTVVQSDLNWGPVNGPAQPVTIARNGADGKNVFATPNLPSNTPYTFSVRDEDLLTETTYGTLTLTTQATDQIDLSIAPQGGGQKSVVGTTNLSASGAFAAPINIPPSEASGNYTLFAILAGSVLATTGFQVIAANQQLPPVIQVIDPGTNTTTDTEEEGSSFTLRGSGFRAGNISITVDSPGGIAIGQTVGDSSGNFQHSFIWPLGVTGAHTVVAEQLVGGPVLEASASLSIQEIPQ